MSFKKKKPKRDSGTRSAVKKGPMRDAKHLAKVRAYGCLVLTSHVPHLANTGSDWWPRIEAHHVRSLGPRIMGRKKSDYLTVPLCRKCHADLHKGNERKFWEDSRIDPAAWIASFSEEGRKAIEALRNGT